MTINQKAYLSLTLGALAISLAPIFVRLSELQPSATAFYRLSLCVPVLFFWIAFTDKQSSAVVKFKYNKRDVLMLSLPGLFFAGDMGFWHWSITYTTVANATLFANFAPIFVTLASFLLFKERFSRLFILALIVATTGMIILMGTSADSGGTFLLGDALGILAAVFYAAYLMSVGKLRGKNSTVLIMFWSSLSASIILLPVSMLSGESLVPDTANGWIVLFALAWVSHIGGQGLIAYALAHLSTAISSVSLLVQPVAAAILAWILFSEALSVIQIFGGLTVLMGIFLARRASA
ncbi:MAG: DMT family transporter [Gammaproteobacteria bacterium]|nr:DMT family transporter [Gammaproteobacteria bacterium]